MNQFAKFIISFLSSTVVLTSASASTDLPMKSCAMVADIEQKTSVNSLNTGLFDNCSRRVLAEAPFFQRKSERGRPGQNFDSQKSNFMRDSVLPFKVDSAPEQFSPPMPGNWTLAGVEERSAWSDLLLKNQRPKKTVPYPSPASELIKLLRQKK